MFSGGSRDWLYDLLAPPLILVAPFLSFVNYNDYSYAAPEIWLAVAALIVAGLLSGAVMALGGTWLRIIGTAGLVTLYVDFQSEWFDDQPALRVPAFALGMLLLCWVVRDNLHRITLPVFATILARLWSFRAARGRRPLNVLTAMRTPREHRIRHLGWSCI